MYSDYVCSVIVAFIAVVVSLYFVRISIRAVSLKMVASPSSSSSKSKVCAPQHVDIVAERAVTAIRKNATRSTIFPTRRQLY